MDEALFALSLEDDEKRSPMLDKEMLFVQDSNGSSYNGQITFDSSSLSNSGRWISWSEGYIQIPFTFTFKSGADQSAAGVINPFLVGLKNGHYQLIDSISVDYNNTNVVQLQPYTNFYVNYKVLTSWSEDDMTKWGDICGVCPDTPDSFTYANDGASPPVSQAGRDGDGFCNNKIGPGYPVGYAGPGAIAELPADYVNNALGVADDNNIVAALNAVKHQANIAINGLRTSVNNALAAAGVDWNAQVGFINTGAYERFQNTALNPTATGTGLRMLDDTDGAKAPLMNYYTASGANAAKVWQWYVVCTIRLKDMHDFFDKMPLTKGGFLRMQINYNSFDCSVTSAANPATTMVLNSVTSKAGRTNPLLVASAAGGQPASALVDNAAQTFSCGIVEAPTNNIAKHSMSACRLYVPAYVLDPEKEASLIELNPVKDIEYEEIYQYSVNEVTTGSTFNQILTNGISDPQKVVVMPFVSTKVHVTPTVPEFQSPFDTAPGTTGPLAVLRDFNVAVGGSNVFQRNKQYDYEAFLDEVCRDNAIDGGVSTGHSNGLISYKMWKNAYRYYVADVSRRNRSERLVPKSISISGVNSTKRDLQLICFITYLRRISINMLDGSIVG